MKAVQTDQSSNRLQEPFIIAKTENGYRVCSALSPGKQYIVSGIPDQPECTCPNFVHPERPPDWQCEHILAVLQHGVGLSGSESAPAQAPTPADASAEPPIAGKNGKKSPDKPAGKGAVMLLKRSVSPDGRIDSLSIEFSCPLGAMTGEEIKEQADKMLALQTVIAGEFLRTAGKSGNQKHVQQNNGNGSIPQNAVAARIIGVGAVKGRFGPKPVLNVLVGDRVLKFFGTEQQLAEAVKATGHEEMAGQLTEGTKFDLPCRVVTKPNGKYTNVERFYPSDNGSNGSA